jgi:signal peptidase II
MFFSRPRFRPWFLSFLVLAAGVAALDLTTKALAERHLREPVALVGAVQLDVGFNSGVAFGVLAGAPSAVVLAAVAVAALAFIVLLAWGVGRPAAPVAALLAGGALANLVDRAGDGRVTDFIEFPRWPAFNVADVAITVGVGLLVLHGLGRERRRQGSPGERPRSSPAARTHR